MTPKQIIEAGASFHFRNTGSIVNPGTQAEVEECIEAESLPIDVCIESSRIFRFGVTNEHTVGGIVVEGQRSVALDIDLFTRGRVDQCSNERL